MKADGESSTHMPARWVNPFATRYTGLGAVAALQSDGTPFEPEAVLEELRMAGGSGLFVGPHGSGKSTRLEACAKAASRGGQIVERVRLRRWRDLWGLLRLSRRLPGGSLLCVDSLEQAGGMGATWLARLARRRGVQLLATSHQPIGGLPVLEACTTSWQLMEKVLEQLPLHGNLIAPAEREAAFWAANGNIRDALFDLYDRFEAAQHAQRS